MHGIYGNSLNLDFQSIDNLFNTLHEEEQIDFMAFGNDFFEDVLTQIFPTVQVSQSYKDGKFRKIMKTTQFQYSTKLEKIGMFIDYYQKKYLKGVANNKQMK